MATMFHSVLILGPENTEAREIIHKAFAVPKDTIEARLEAPGAVEGFDLIVVDATAWPEWIEVEVVPEPPPEPEEAPEPAEDEAVVGEGDESEVGEEGEEEASAPPEPPAPVQPAEPPAPPEPIIERRPAPDLLGGVEALMGLEPEAPVVIWSAEEGGERFARFVEGEDEGGGGAHLAIGEALAEAIRAASAPKEPVGPPPTPRELFIRRANQHEAAEFDVVHPRFEVAWRCKVGEDGSIVKTIVGLPKGLPAAMKDRARAAVFRGSFEAGEFATIWLDPWFDGLNWLRAPGEEERFVTELMRAIERAWQAQQSGGGDEIEPLLPGDGPWEVERLVEAFYGLVWRVHAFDAQTPAESEAMGLKRALGPECRSLRAELVEALVTSGQVDEVAVAICKRYEARVSRGVKQAPYPSPWRFYLKVEHTIAEAHRLSNGLVEAQREGAEVSMRRWGQLMSYFEHRQQSGAG